MKKGSLLSSMALLLGFGVFRYNGFDHDFEEPKPPEVLLPPGAVAVPVMNYAGDEGLEALNKIMTSCDAIQLMDLVEQMEEGPGHNLLASTLAALQLMEADPDEAIRLVASVGTAGDGGHACAWSWLEVGDEQSPVVICFHGNHSAPISASTPQRFASDHGCRAPIQEMGLKEVGARVMFHADTLGMGNPDLREITEMLLEPTIAAAADPSATPMRH